MHGRRIRIALRLSFTGRTGNINNLFKTFIMANNYTNEGVYVLYLRWPENRPTKNPSIWTSDSKENALLVMKRWFDSDEGPYGNKDLSIKKEGVLASWAVVTPWDASNEKPAKPDVIPGKYLLEELLQIL